MQLSADVAITVLSPYPRLVPWAEFREYPTVLLLIVITKVPLLTQAHITIRMLAALQAAAFTMNRLSQIALIMELSHPLSAARNIPIWVQLPEMLIISRQIVALMHRSLIPHSVYRTERQLPTLLPALTSRPQTVKWRMRSVTVGASRSV